MKEDITGTSDLLISIIKSAPYGIIAIDRAGLIIMCNSLALKHLGVNAKTNALKKKALTLHTVEVPRLHKRLMQGLNKEQKAFNLNNIKASDKILNVKGRPIPGGMIITTSDITEAKNSQASITNALLEGQENERRRLAKEIHDGIGPLMSTIKLNIESVKRDMDEASEKTLQKIENMEELIHSVSTDIRSISHALMPNAIKDFGLVSALENLVLKTNVAESVNLRLIHIRMEERLDIYKELGLYRITQELINNALKYAQADNLVIQLIRHPKFISLTVEDDGVGFDPDTIPELVDSGIGLQNIKTRSEAMGGVFRIDSSLGRGVTASVDVPIKSKNKKL